MLLNILIASPCSQPPHTSTLTSSLLVSSGYRGKGCPQRLWACRKDYRGIQSLGCLGSPTLQHELKENLKVTEQVSRPPPAPLSSMEPHKNSGCCSKALWSLHHSTRKTRRFAHFRSGSMTNQMQVFPKYPHILNKHKLGDGQLNSTLIWAAWLFSPKTCCP